MPSEKKTRVRVCTTTAVHWQLRWFRNDGLMFLDFVQLISIATPIAKFESRAVQVVAVPLFSVDVSVELYC
jgi:hypothetical protein